MAYPVHPMFVGKRTTFSTGRTSSLIFVSSPSDSSLAWFAAYRLSPFVLNSIMKRSFVTGSTNSTPHDSKSNKSGRTACRRWQRLTCFRSQRNSLTKIRGWHNRKVNLTCFKDFKGAHLAVCDLAGCHYVLINLAKYFVKEL